MSRVIAVVLVLVLAAGCDSGGKEAPPAQDQSHGHAAPHGGVLVEVGDHEANVELSLDSQTGTLTLWALDGHAANAVRLSDKSIPVEVTIGTVEMALRLQPVANALSGETVGDTSEFSAQHESLKGAATVKVRIPKIVIRGAEGIVLEAEVPAAN